MKMTLIFKSQLLYYMFVFVKHLESS